MHVFNKTQLFCPNCGEQTVVRVPSVYEENAGDQHICYSCTYGFMHDGEYVDLPRNAVVDIVISARKQRGEELAREATIDAAIHNAPDCVYGCAGKHADVTDSTIEVFCNECGEFLDAAELEDPGEEE